ncbi:MAG TPA: hypothetical protein VGC42_20465 [Kofleriaceae bacterium]
MGQSFDDHLLARPLPAPYQLAIEGLPFQLTVLDGDAGVARDSRLPIAAASQFTLALLASTRKRYLYLVQKATATGLVELILLCDRSELAGEPPALGLRVPPGGAWLRAAVDGRVHVMASDLVLSHRSITAWIGGCEPARI